MSRSLRHGALAATALVFSIASLSACSAGNDAQTLQVRPDNAATAVDNIKIQNANIITQPGHETEGPAVVNATLFNEGPKAEVLEAVKLPGTNATVELHAAEGKGPIKVPAGGRVILGGKGNASAVIGNGRQAGSDGNVQSVVFTFSETGDVGLGALIVPASGFFEGFGPSTLPSPKPTPSKGASETPGANPSESAGRQSDTPSDVESGSDTQTDEDSAAH
ncbi:DUF461 domain-containing protein [Streptomyces sp. B1I3]|uniref:DUF461 domain-containing protein n=1 Tax=Streptomyces sp. B1I3 TaxID=3042264 RepID=UPI0027810F77|nr:DUF461 domain-containing protein [Streptomyces sp. B1I3]MDQ0794862.1 hypothetical protein [Streptomyces sp. B1I3]